LLAFIGHRQIAQRLTADWERQLSATTTPSGAALPPAVVVPGWLAEIARPLLRLAAYSFAINLLALTTPLFVLQVIARMMPGQAYPAGQDGEMQTLISIVAAAGLAYVALAKLETMRRQTVAHLAEILEARLGHAVLLRATAPATALGERPAAATIARDLDQLHDFTGGSALIAWIDLPFAVIFLVTMATLHWAIGAAGLVCFAAQTAILLMVARAGGGRVDNSENAARAHAFGEALSRHADCATTMDLGAALTRRWQMLRFGAGAGAIGHGRRDARLAAACRVAGLGGRCVILGVGAVLARHHEIGVGAIFAGYLLMGRALAPVQAVTNGWCSFIAARTASNRLRTTIAVPHQPVHGLAPARGELVLESVAWTPAGALRPALRGVTLKIEAGAMLAVIGPSAAGKSTLARVLCGALRPGEGIVRLDGTEIGLWGEQQLGAAIGYLPQDVALFPGTIADNISRFGSATEFQIVAAARLAGVHEMIRQLPAGYRTVLDDNAGVLSAGQRQRVALARALLGDPPVLVLDEPDASLDAEGEAALIACMIEARRRRRTVIMITHNAGLVRVADFVATMVGGHVMKVQRTAEVLGRPAMLATG
jgi:PrtD family type I secretion system ABC transporter